MKNSIARYLSFVMPAALFLSTAWADQVVMKNGDRVTGTIVKQDGKTITVKTANLGVVTAPWDQVASIESDKPLHVVLKDGKTLVGKLTPIEGKEEVTTADAKVDVSFTDFAAIRDDDEQKAYERLLHPGLLTLVRQRQHRFGRHGRQRQDVHLHAGRQRGAHHQHR